MPNPYDLSCPERWTARQDGDAVAYTNDEGTRRVTITELSRGLSLFWWVDAARRPTPETEWRPIQTDVGDSFRDHEAAVAAAETLVETFTDGAVVDDEAPAELVADGG